MRRNIYFVLAVFMLVSVSIGLAQQTGDKIYLGELVKLNSQVLNEERILLIYTPTGYGRENEGCPVMHLLDGTGNFHHVTGIVDFMIRQSMIPPMIVVALVNTDRNRDFTPTRDLSSDGRNIESAGGAGTFRNFFAEELIPYIDSAYNTNDYRILVGHSFGGLFAIDALLNTPELFNAYIAISPTFWWDDHYLARKARPFFKENPELKEFLYFSMGNEGQQMIEGAQRFELLLKNEAPKNLEWHYDFMERDDHGTTPHLTVYNGLETLYDGWRLPNEYYDSSVAAVQKHYDSLSEKYGYTIKIPENTLNIMGYRALGDSDYAKAIDIFRLNVEKYPESANVYDSLGEGYESRGDFGLAQINYEIACRLGKDKGDPNLSIYQNHLDQLRQKAKL